MSNTEGTGTGNTAPGWYPDPTNGQMRWFDGTQWGQFAEPGREAPTPMAAPGAQAGGTDPKQMAMLAHLLGIVAGFVGPLIIMMTSGEKDPFIKHHSVEALNFQITIIIAYIVAAITCLIFHRHRLVAGGNYRRHCVLYHGRHGREQRRVVQVPGQHQVREGRCRLISRAPATRNFIRIVQLRRIRALKTSRKLTIPATFEPSSTGRCRNP